MADRVEATSPRKVPELPPALRLSGLEPVTVTEDMIGHKFGEFSPTRTFHGHAADKKSKR